MRKINKTTKTYKQIEPLSELITTGRMLCIDPSTGSTSSKPGFAVYNQGELLEAGEIDLDVKMNRSKRLYEISRTIREEFQLADILCVEYIPPVSYRGGMNSNAIMALQKAIGAILAAQPFEYLLEIPASAWKQAKDDDYYKSDMMDSVYLGKYVIDLAEHIINNSD